MWPLLSNQSAPAPLNAVPLADVYPGRLYIGDWRAREPALLGAHAIGAVVALGTMTDFQRLYRPLPDAWHQEGDDRECSLRLGDHPAAPLLDALTDALPFIDEHRAAGRHVLVHCAMGRSRSASIVIAYVMRAHHTPYDAALAHVRAARPCVAPNPGFAQQLARDYAPTLGMPAEDAQVDLI